METSLRKKHKKKKKMLARIIFFVIFLLVMSSAFVLNADAFRVKIIEVSGVNRVSAEEIYEETNISIGENLLTIPASFIRDSIILNQPLVKNADVHRVLPSRIQIKIHEREPFAYVTDGERYYMIDEERVVLETPNGIPDTGLFRITTDGLQHANIGEKIEFPMDGQFGTIATSLKKALDGKYEHLLFNHRGVKLYLNDGTYVLMGDGSEIEKKIMLIPVIIRELRERNEPFEGLNLSSLAVPSYIKKS
ncbi:MAG TPA: FtsQ-type POTRA domain-containing protein [bacterium]|nr:FtsQ-type POTRA domain-containing protein [bacterium]